MIRSILPSLILGALLGVISGCTQSKTNDFVEPEKAENNKNLYSTNLSTKTMSLDYCFDEDKNFVESLGYDVSTFIDAGDYYIVGDDYFVKKERLATIKQDSSYQQAMNSTAYDPYLIYEDRLVPICEKISIGHSTNIADSMIDAAIEEWNDIDFCNLEFTSRHSDQAHANGYPVDIQGYYFGSGKLIREDMAPIAGTPQSVTIDLANPIFMGFNEEQTKNFIMHLIGHIIRLGDLPDYQLSFNPNSIMKPHSELTTSNNNIWSGLSNEDKSSLADTYPIPGESSLSYELNTILVNPTDDMRIKAGASNTLNILYENYYYESNNGIRYEYKVLSGEEEYKSGRITNSSLNLKIDDAGSYTFTLNIYAGNSLLEEHETNLYVHQVEKLTITNPQDSYTERNVYNIKFSPIENNLGAAVDIVYSSENENNIIERKSNYNIEVVFSGHGTQTIKMDIYFGIFKLYTYYYDFIVDEYVPIPVYDWTPKPKNTTNKLLKDEKYTLVIRDVPLGYDFDLQITPRVEGGKYTKTTVDKRTFELTFEDTGMYDAVLKLSLREEVKVTEEFVITIIEQPFINPTWSAASEIGEYYALSTDYTLNLNYVNDYYDNSNGFTYTFAVYLNDADMTSTVLKSKNGQQAVFNFNLPGEYRIVATVKRGSTVLETYETTCPVVGGKIVRGNSPDEPTLNSAYTFTYHYWHPEHEEVSYEFKMSEELFDAGSSSNIYYQMESANSFMISFHDYGCYYIEATVKDGYEVCDKKIINFTKLYHPETCTFNALAVLPNMGYGEIRNYVKFNVQIGSGSTLPERFFGYIQKYKEIRRAFYITGERRVDREFTHTLLTIQLEKESNALCNLPDGGFGISLNPSDPYEIYEGYTGYIHYPMDGVRLVPSKEIEILPKQQIRYDLNNLTEINF